MVETDVSVLTSYHTKLVIWSFEDSFVYLFYFDRYGKHRLNGWKKIIPSALWARQGLVCSYLTKIIFLFWKNYFRIWVRVQMHMDHWTRCFLGSTLVSFMRKPWVTKGRINVLGAMAESFGAKLMEQKEKSVFSPPKETWKRSGDGGYSWCIWRIGDAVKGLANRPEMLLHCSRCGGIIKTHF